MARAKTIEEAQHKQLMVKCLAQGREGSKQQLTRKGKKRDLSTLLWCDLKDDAERVEFIRSGRASDTGIISPAMERDLIEVFKFRLESLV